MKKILIVVIIGISILSCSKNAGKKRRRNKKNNKTAVVYVAKTERRDLENYLTYSISLKAKRDVYLYAPARERIVSINVKEGDRVNEGDIIAQMDSEEAQLRYEKVKANYTSIKSEFNRTKQLYQDEMISKQNYENMLAKYENAKADYKIQKKELNDLTIKSPIDGIVGRRFVEEKEKVEMNQRLFRIVEDKILKADINLPEKEFRFVKEGARVVIYKKDTNKKINGFVNEISPIIDEETGTFKVEVNVRGNNQFIPGMFVNVDIITREKEDCLSVPSKSVIKKDEKNGVYIIKDNKAKFKEVSTGIEQNKYIEIKEGLKENQEIVTVGQNMLKDGQKVKIMNKENKKEDKKENKNKSNKKMSKEKEKDNNENS